MFYKPRHAKPSPAKIRTAACASSGVAMVGLLSNPAAASANPLSAPVAGSSDAVNQGVRQAAWDTRNAVHHSVAGLPQHIADAARGAVDNAVNGAFPGLIQERTAPAPMAAPANPGFDTGSCPPAARACIDLAGQRSWLQRNGQVTYGAVPISSGAQGWETPRGTHHVTRKVQNEISREFNNAPMPYSVYFTNNGIAFHQGDVNLLSHGCIHLNHNDAVTYFNDLQVGDMVYVY
ncbi:MAG: L,D-transpeptidase [Corynebacterium sp.]|nr:L,D-transpeptidase [Corynebacterium sp.]